MNIRTTTALCVALIATTQFMANIGSIKQSPAPIGDLFFRENAAQKGD